MNAVQRVLAIGAHPDDIELGCGGTIAKLAKQGVIVEAMVLTRGVNGCDDSFNRAIETNEALKALGVSLVWQYDFKDTELASQFNDIVRAIEDLIWTNPPQRVYTMFEHDRHQDHRAVFEASIVACRKVPQILSYETPSSWPNFSPVVFEDISDYMERKVEALQLHHSQKDRHYIQPHHLRTSALFRGHQICLGPSEGFIPYKFVL